MQTVDFDNNGATTTAFVTGALSATVIVNDSLATILAFAPDLCVLVLLLAQIDDRAGIYPLSDYVANFYDLADTNNIPLLDLTRRWGGSYATANARGFMADLVHNSQARQDDFAEPCTRVAASDMAELAPPVGRIVGGIVGSAAADKLLATGGLAVANAAAATTPGTVVKKMQVFDANGVSLGYVPVYDAIT
jgi:hypothetical protein